MVHPLLLLIEDSCVPLSGYQGGILKGMDTTCTRILEGGPGYTSMNDECLPTRSFGSYPLTESQSLSLSPQVKIATTEAEKRRIYALRYTAYIKEMHGEKRHTEADNRRQEFRDDWDDTAYHFYAEQDGMLGGCSRINLRRDGPFECEEQLGIERFKPSFPAHVCLTSRLVVRPNFKRGNLLKQLSCAMYQFKLEQGIHYSFLDCHPQLLPLYSRLGYRLYSPGFNHKKYTYVIPMVLVVNDICHLDRVKSPLAAVAHRYGYSSSTAIAVAWDGRQTFMTGDTTVMPAHNVSIDACHPDRHLDASDAELFEDLTPIEVKTLASLGHIISCRAGDNVLNPGDPGREIFVILSGTFQVQRRIFGPTRPEFKVLKILSAGETFGEMRFLTDELRHASVKAREDSTLLVLNAKALDRLVTTAPKIAAKVFRNIARIIATRVCDGVRFLRLPKARRHNAVVNA